MGYVVGADGYYGGIFHSEFQEGDFEDLTDYEQFCLLRTVEYCDKYKLELCVLMESIYGGIKLGKIFVNDGGYTLPNKFRFMPTVHFKKLIANYKQS